MNVQDEFISRMRPENSGAMADKPRSSLKYLIDQAISEIIELDRVSGNNAGQEMIDLMIRFFTRLPPPTEYKNLEDFLLYRHEDAAVP